MQQLQDASDSFVCARTVLEAMLEVMVTMREKASKNAHGPTLIHMRALGVLRKRPGATLSMLSDQLALTLSASSRLVESLVAKKLVQRVVPPGNRRTVSLQLTSAGAKVFDAKLIACQRELAKVLQKLSAKERAALSQSADLLLRVMMQYAE